MTRARAGQSTTTATTSASAGRLRANRRPVVLLGAGGVALLGLLLRLYRLNATSLWLDEGFTVFFSRLPWIEVTGLRGEYDPHPPLYYTLVKAVGLVLPDLYAGRALSVAAGAATVPVLYLLVARLAGPLAGLLSAGALAVSPLHVWYSQEARQYAMVTLMVAVSYLSLAGFEQGRDRRWAALYGVSVLAAVYIEYSALFALIPQLAFIAVMIYRARAAALPLMTAGSLAVAGFLPWLPQLARSIDRVGDDRAWYLGVSLERVVDSALSVAALKGQGLYFWGGPTPWDRWPDLRLPLAEICVAAALLGMAALWRRSRLVLGTALALGGGTVLTAALLSILSPAYAERTVLPAALGWCILAGCAPLAGSSRLSRAVGTGAYAGIIAVSLVTLIAIYDGDRQHWDDLAADTRRTAGYSWPVIVAPAVSETLIGLYEPEALAGEHYVHGGLGPLSGEAQAAVAASEAVWLAHIDSAESRHVREILVAAGFEPVMARQHRDRLYLELLARPGGVAGRSIGLNGRFAGERDEIPGWTLRDGSVEIDEGPQGREVTLTREVQGESALVSVAPIAGSGLVLLTVEVNSRLDSGQVRVFLICQDAAETWTGIYPDPGGASVPAGGGWRRLRVAALCPDGTESVRVDLRNGGTGSVSFRDVSLQWVEPG